MLDFAIVNGPKTGSTLVTRLVDQHPDVTCMHESYAPNLGDPSHILAERAKFEAHGFPLDRQQEWLDLFRTAPNQVEGYRRVIDNLGADMTARTGAKVFGDSWPLYGPYIDMVRNCYTDTKFIYGTRDPRAVWHSAARYYNKTEAGDYAVQQLMLTEQRIVHMQRQEPERLFVYKYEDLVANPREVMNKIWRFLGVDPMKGWIEYDPEKDTMPGRWGWVDNAAKPIDASRVNAWIEEMDEISAQRVTAATVSIMERHGYDPKLKASRTGLDVLTRFCGGQDWETLDPDEIDAMREEVRRLRQAMNIALKGISMFIQESEQVANRYLEDRSDDQWIQDYTLGYGNGMARVVCNLSHVFNMIAWAGVAPDMPKPAKEGGK